MSGLARIHALNVGLRLGGALAGVSGLVRFPLFHLWVGCLMGASWIRFGLVPLTSAPLVMLVLGSTDRRLLFVGCLMGLGIGSLESFLVKDIFDFGALTEFLRFKLGGMIDAQYPSLEMIQRALILGDGSQIPSSVWKNFHWLGLSHLLVISGSHIGLMISMALAFSQRLAALFSRGRTYLAFRLLLLLLVLLLALTCNAGVSVVRAVGVFVLAWVVSLIWPAILRYSSIDRLALVGLAMALVDPRSVFAPSYALSFGASLGLLWIIRFKPRPYEVLLFPSFFVLPICHLFQFRMTALAPIMNWLGIPIFEGIIMPLSLLCLFVRALSSWADSLFGGLLGLLGLVGGDLMMWDPSRVPPRTVSVLVTCLTLIAVIRVNPKVTSRLLLWSGAIVYHLGLVIWSSFRL